MLFGRDQAPKEKVRRLKEQGAKAIADGKLEVALDIFGKANELSPNDEFIRSKIAFLLGKLGRRNEAVAIYEDLAAKHVSTGFTLKAIAAYKLILHLDPDNAATRQALAAIYEERGYGAERPSAPAVPAATPPLPTPRPGWVPQARSVTVLDAAAMALPPMPPNPQPEDTAEMPVMDFPPMPPPRTRPPPPPTMEMRSPLAGRPMPGLVEDLDLDFEEVPPPPKIDPDAVGVPPLFAELPHEAFVSLLELMKLNDYEPGAKIIVEGEMGLSMYVIVEGEVDVVREKDGTVLSHLKSGAIFGEIALLSGIRRTATIIASTPCTALELGRDALDAIVRLHPRVEAAINRHFKDRLVASLLATNATFEPLSGAERRQLADRCTLKKVGKGEVLERQGQMSEWLHIVLRGRCGMGTVGPDKQERILPELDEGSMFGEVSLLLRQPSSVTIVSITPCTLLCLGRDDLRAVLLPNKAVWRELLSAAHKRLAQVAGAG